MAGLNEPGLHNVHDIVPFSDVYEPLGQGWHDDNPDVGALVPGSHGTLDVWFNFELYVPGSHGVHESWFDVFVKVPGGQRVHSATFPLLHLYETYDPF